jgi:hypothetical protein
MYMNRECLGCGSKVSDQFARVYGDNEDNVHRCMSCIDPDDGGRSLLRHGAAAYENIEEVEERMIAPRMEYK